MSIFRVKLHNTVNRNEWWESNKSADVNNLSDAIAWGEEGVKKSNAERNPDACICVLIGVEMILEVKK